MQVLQHNPAIANAMVEAKFHAAIRETMVRMCLADGVVDPSEVSVIPEVYARLTSKQLSDEEIHKEVTRAQGDRRSSRQHLGDLVG